MNPTIALMMQSAARNRAAARNVQSAGRSRGVAGDTINARISPREAMLLRALGAHGSLNPRTGQRHFAAATGTPAAGPIPQPPQLGGYSLAPLMSQSPGGNFIGNAYGQVPSWATSPFQLGVAPQYPNPNWRFPTGGAFNSPVATGGPPATQSGGGFTGGGQSGGGPQNGGGGGPANGDRPGSGLPDSSGGFAPGRFMSPMMSTIVGMAPYGIGTAANVLSGISGLIAGSQQLNMLGEGMSPADMVAAATGTNLLGSYRANGVGGYGNIGMGGYVGAQNMADPGVMGAARALSADQVANYAAGLQAAARTRAAANNAAGRQGGNGNSGDGNNSGGGGSNAGAGSGGSHRSA